MKAADFENDILQLRREGKSYDAIVLWLAINKQFVVSPGAVRGVVKKAEAINAAKK